MASKKTWLRLGTIGLCGVALAMGREFYGSSIVPLRQREAETLREVEDSSKRLADARKTIGRIRAQENDAEHVESELKRLQDELPAGASTVAVPALVKERFARFDLPVSLVRLNPILDAPALPGYGYGNWSVSLPIDETGQNIQRMLLAVADLDQQNAFVRVLTFHIRPDYDNPGSRVATLNLGALVRK